MVDQPSEFSADDKVNLLLVDDDTVDILSLQRAFKKLEFGHPIHVAHDGVDALRLLRGHDGRGGIPKPHLIVLDLNMPRMNGVEFLKQLRADPEVCDATVFVVTTSADPADIRSASDQNINGYIVKSGHDRSFADIATLIAQYCRVVAFP